MKIIFSCSPPFFPWYSQSPSSSSLSRRSCVLCSRKVLIRTKWKPFPCLCPEGFPGWRFGNKCVGPFGLSFCKNSQKPGEGTEERKTPAITSIQGWNYPEPCRKPLQPGRRPFLRDKKGIIPIRMEWYEMGMISMRIRSAERTVLRNKIPFSSFDSG